MDSSNDGTPATPEPIPPRVERNFQELMVACDKRSIALVSVKRKRDDKTGYLICVISTTEDGEYLITPYAELIDEAPEDLYYDPTKD
jgi:hypothetical protein